MGDEKGENQWRLGGPPNTSDRLSYLHNVPYTVEPLIKDTSVYTSIKIIKNEVGCRDDTVPKTVDTRRHCEEE